MPFIRGDRVIVKSSGFRGVVVADEEPGGLVMTEVKEARMEFAAEDLSYDPDATLPLRPEKK